METVSGASDGRQYAHMCPQIFSYLRSTGQLTVESQGRLAPHAHASVWLGRRWEQVSYGVESGVDDTGGLDEGGDDVGEQDCTADDYAQGRTRARGVIDVRKGR